MPQLLGIGTDLELRTSLFALPIGATLELGGQPSAPAGESIVGKIVRPALYRGGRLVSAPWGEPPPWQLPVAVLGIVFALGLWAVVKAVRR